MRFFKSRKKDDVLDLTERFNRQQEKEEQIGTESSQESSASPLGFFGAIANTASSKEAESESYMDLSSGAEGKRKKLVKRLIDMTEKIEEISNQIYHLQQRIEVIEKKLDVNRFE